MALQSPRPARPDHSALIAALEAKEAEFRENVFARALCAALAPAACALLTALQVCEEPVPLAAALALDTGPRSPATKSAMVSHLTTAVAWGLAYVWQMKGQHHWLAAPFLRPILGEPPTEASPAVLAVLQKLWWDDAVTWTEPRVIELHRLALAAGQHALACDHADRVCTFWLMKNRSREAAALAALTLDAIKPRRDPRLLTARARALLVLGEGEESANLFAEATALHGDGEMDDEKAATLFSRAGLHVRHGKLEEAEAIYRDQLLPFFTAKGEAGLREWAITQMQIADILRARGEMDEALHIHREEVLPVLEKLGDVRSRAVTMGKIADILIDRGELDEVLRIYRTEVLPVYEKLGEVRERAVTMGKIADILRDRGELDEALRILCEEVLPVFEKLGEVHARAVTMGKIAYILRARGELDGALRILRQELLPACEKLGEVRELAVTLGQIADILRARGQLDEALRIRREEQLPVFEKLGDARERVVTLGKIADILRARGELDEALRILRVEVLPVFEKLGTLRELIVGRANVAQMLAMRGHEEDGIEVAAHLAWAWREARRMGLPEARQIEEIAERIGLKVEVLAQVASRLESKL